MAVCEDIKNKLEQFKGKTIAGFGMVPDQVVETLVIEFEGGEQLVIKADAQLTFKRNEMAQLDSWLQLEIPASGKVWCEKCDGFGMFGLCDPKQCPDCKGSGYAKGGAK